MSGTATLLGLAAVLIGGLYYKISVTGILFGLAAVLIGVVYLKMYTYYSYWSKKGVPVPVSPKPFVGNIMDVIFLRQSFGCFCNDFYNKTKSFPFVGMYAMEEPALLVNDLELIKTILTKDFIHFTDHNKEIDGNKNPLLLNLFSLTGEAWKNMRVKLTPTFTTSKIKFMFKTVADCNVEMLDYMEKNYHGQNNAVDFKELFATLNTDVIGSCAFGIECNSFKDPNSQFRKIGRSIFVITPKRFLLQLLRVVMPEFIKKRISFGSGMLVNVFYKLVEDTIKHREENNITRNDFMQLLINLRRDGSVDGKDPKIKQADGTTLTIMELAAQVFVFFIAGFETSSTAASYTLYELALNTKIQNKLRKEIDEVLAKHDGQITYEALSEMNYLGMVLDESLRKYPPVPSLRRVCTKEYTIPNTDVTIEKGTILYISNMGIHRDPEFYPDPMKFDPERFTPENKASRHNFAYMPFGEGPRLCIGNRFGLMQSKLGLVTVLSKYEVSPCDKTQIPIKFNKTSPVLLSEGGVWLKVTPRVKTF